MDDVGVPSPNPLHWPDGARPSDARASAIAAALLLVLIGSLVAAATYSAWWASGCPVAWLLLARLHGH